MDTAVAALSHQGKTPSVRLVHRLELLLALQNTELYGVIPDKVAASSTTTASQQQQQQQQPAIPSFTASKPAFTLSAFAFGGSDTVKKSNARTRQLRLSAEGGIPKGTAITAHTSNSSSSSSSSTSTSSSISSYGVLFSPPSLGHVQLCARSTDSDWSEPLDARRYTNFTYFTHLEQAYVLHIKHYFSIVLVLLFDVLQHSNLC
jgi:hypothetical protein